MNIAVIDLDPTGISNNEAEFLSDRLRTELFETGKFQVVEREKMNAILHEQGFQQTGCTSVECAIEIGQLLNVRVMVAGTIGKIDDLYSLSIRMINVESGAIIRTATRDYEGKLSEVLTEVIPEVSAKLAEAESIESEKTEEERLQKQDLHRFAILLKGGFSFLSYTSDINQAIKDLKPSVSQFFNDLSNHSNIGLEARYALSQRWKLKIGLGIENLISAWTVTIDNSVLFQEWSFEREYQFVNTYIGVNFSLWQKPEIYDIYLGMDIGSTLFNSRLKQHFVLNDGTTTDKDDAYEYTAFIWKLSFGGIYFLSSRFSLGLELALKSGGKFNTSDQLPENVQDEDSAGIIFPREVDSSGLQIVFYFGYHF
jgi:TolB-like protein